MPEVVSLEDFSELLDSLYEGPFEPDPYCTFLDGIRGLLALSLAVITLRQPEGADGGLLFLSSKVEEKTFVDAHNNPYTDKYFAMDPLVDLPFGEVVTLDEVISDAELEASDYYKMCMADSDVFHVAGVDLRNANKQRFSVRFCRPKDAPNFSASEKDFFRVLSRHIERSVVLGMRLVQLDSERQVFVKAMSGYSIGTVTLDENARVLNSNGAADVLLRDKDGISLFRDQLQLKNSDLNDRLRGLVSDALEAQRKDETVPLSAMSIPRPSGHGDYELVIKAMPVDRYVESKNSPHLIVFINDPEKKVTVSVRTLMTLYHLTQTEATLSVLLSEGKNLDEVSQELGIARNTARAHLRSIFSKTGVTQQSMLVSLVLKSLASLPS